MQNRAAVFICTVGIGGYSFTLGGLFIGTTIYREAGYLALLASTNEIITGVINLVWLMAFLIDEKNLVLAVLRKTVFPYKLCALMSLFLMICSAVCYLPAIPVLGLPRFVTSMVQLNLLHNLRLQFSRDAPSGELLSDEELLLPETPACGEEGWFTYNLTHANLALPVGDKTGDNAHHGRTMSAPELALVHRPLKPVPSPVCASFES